MHLRALAGPGEAEPIMLRTFLLAACILAAAVPALSSAAEEPSLPAWLGERLAARGLHVDAADVRVLRTVTGGGATSTFEVPLSALVAEDPFEGREVAPVAAPEVLAGDLTYHIMLQLDCAGYGAQQVAAGLSAIRGSTWDLGLHVAVGPLAGGAAVGTGADATSPSNLVAVVNTDNGMTLAAGDLSTTYDRIQIFGFCLLGIGQMTGTGAWVFS